MPEDFAAQERLIHQLDRESARRTEAVRGLIQEQGRPDVLAEFDANMRDLRTGVTGARSTWHSISGAQRRVLLLLAEGSRRLIRQRASRNLYDGIGEPHAVAGAATLATVRNLARRELLAWEGGAFDPERIAVLTERGRFVIAQARKDGKAHA